MAILWMEGFEVGEESIRFDVWGNTPDIHTDYGRLGNLGCRGGYFNKLFGISDDTLAYSFAVNVQAAAHNDQVFRNMYGTNSGMNWRTGNQLLMTEIVGATGYETTAGNFTKGAWHWIEVELYWHASAGTLKVWINGVLEINESALNTGTRPATVTPYWGTSQAAHVDEAWYDDIVMSDGAGSYNNTRPLGDSVVRALVPVGDGNSSDLLGSDFNKVSNYLLVDAVTEPTTTDFVGSSTEGEKDLYTLSDLQSSTGAVLGIEVLSKWQKTDAGTKYGRAVVRTGGVDYPQTSVALPLSWSNRSDLIEENPGTTSAWTASEVNALEAGFEVRDS